VYIPVKQLIGHDSRALIYEIISSYGFSEKQVDELIKLAASESGKYISAPDGRYRIIKHRHWFIISPVEGIESENIIIEEGVNAVPFVKGYINIKRLSIHHSPFTIHDSIASLDSKLISFPLLLRKWKTGDYFYPLGMKKKKKIARFLVDLKLSKTQKENTWVIESAQRIIWVVGHRIDERFKITEKTKEVLQLELH
jgi:tRNA(Ile)-lysidine synthase